MSQRPAVWAVLPVKNTVDAKQRLVSVLSPPERQALFVAMLHDVLAALAGASRLAGVVVLTRDAEAGEIAKSFGAEVVPEPGNDGHSAAVARGAIFYLLTQPEQP